MRSMGHTLELGNSELGGKLGEAVSTTWIGD